PAPQFFSAPIPCTPRTTLFPYTTLFRSISFYGAGLPGKMPLGLASIQSICGSWKERNCYEIVFAFGNETTIDEDARRRIHETSYQIRICRLLRSDHFTAEFEG